jgi:hypothetical protein
MTMPNASKVIAATAGAKEKNNRNQVHTALKDKTCPICFCEVESREEWFITKSCGHAVYPKARFGGGFVTSECLEDVISERKQDIASKLKSIKSLEYTFIVTMSVAMSLGVSCNMYHGQTTVCYEILCSWVIYRMYLFFKLFMVHDEQEVSREILSQAIDVQCPCCSEKLGNKCGAFKCRNGAPFDDAKWHDNNSERRQPQMTFNATRITYSERCKIAATNIGYPDFILAGICIVIYFQILFPVLKLIVAGACISSVTYFNVVTDGSRLNQVYVLKVFGCFVLIIGFINFQFGTSVFKMTLIAVICILLIAYIGALIIVLAFCDGISQFFRRFARSRC